MIEDLRREFNLQNVVIRTLLPPYPVQAFGIKKQDSNNPYDNKIDLNTNQDNPLYFSQLGTPVFTDLQFTGNSYDDNFGVKKTFDTIKFDMILVTVSQSKNIITTAIQGRDGTVKEYIGMGDYSVTINGIITGSNGHYPLKEVRDLKNMLDAPIAIDIASWYLQNLDIHSLVIQDYELPQEQGGYSYQAFSINAISDTPQEIQIYN